MFTPHQRIFLQAPRHATRIVPVSHKKSPTFRQTPHAPSTVKTPVMTRLKRGFHSGWENIKANSKRTLIAAITGTVVGIIPPLHFTWMVLPVVLAACAAFDFILGFIRGF